MSTVDMTNVQAASVAVATATAALDAAIKTAISCGAKVNVQLEHKQVNPAVPTSGVMVCGITAETTLVLPIS